MGQRPSEVADQLSDVLTVEPVVVGHDGHPHAERLVDAAAAEASRRGVPLVILGVVPSVDNPDFTVQAQRREMQVAVERTALALRDSASRLRELRPDLSIATRSLVQPEDDEVLAALAPCSLLVLGSHGPGQRPAFAMDTTSQRLLRAAACPVLVVPVHTPPRTPTDIRHVVVGVPEDHGDAVRVVTAALGMASPSDRVIAIHAYRRHDGESIETARARGDHSVAKAIATATATAATESATVTRLLTLEPAASALIEQAPGASMLVVGSRGPMALAGMTLDSVSHAVLESLPCPVLIVPRSP